jgi:spore coat protein Z
MQGTECCSNTILPFFPTDDPVIGFQATGICIFIKVEKIIGITCLDPITPLQTDDSLGSHSSY